MGERADRGRPEDRSTRHGREDGAAAVEFALVALPLFLLVFGIIQYGLLFSQVQAADSTAKDAARWASESFAGCDDWQSRTLDRVRANGISDDLSPVAVAGFDVGEGTVTVTISFTPLRVVPFVPVPSKVDRSVTSDLESPPPTDADPTCAG